MFPPSGIVEWVAFPPPGDFPDPGIKLRSTALAGNFFTTEPPGKPFTNSEVLQTLSFNHWPLGCSLSSLSPFLSCPAVGLKVPTLGTTEDEMVGWHHQLKGPEVEQATGVGDGQGSLACCVHGATKSWTQLSYLTDWVNYKVSNTYTLQNVSVGPPGVTSLA